MSLLEHFISLASFVQRFQSYFLLRDSQNTLISRFSSWREWKTQRNFRKSKLWESASTWLKISRHICLLMKRNNIHWRFLLQRRRQLRRKQSWIRYLRRKTPENSSSYLKIVNPRIKMFATSGEMCFVKLFFFLMYLCNEHPNKCETAVDINLLWINDPRRICVA